MEFNDVLRKAGIEPETVVIIRHGFSDSKKRRTLMHVASENPELFDAFQSVQDERLEGAMERLNHKGCVAAFIGNEPKKALFLGLFRIAGSVPMRPSDLYKTPLYKELDRIGLMTRQECKNEFHRKFQLEQVPEFDQWKGRLLISWSNERAWYRYASNNQMRVLAIHEKVSLDVPMPEWNELNLTWDELSTMPREWREALRQWRGIYYIRDMTDGLGYVGSACGDENLYQRWSEYAANGHGGNNLLRKRNYANFRFSILQRFSPDEEKAVILKAESSWKSRLSTHRPHGLNDN